MVCTYKIPWYYQWEQSKLLYYFKCIIIIIKWLNKYTIYLFLLYWSRYKGFGTGNWHFTISSNFSLSQAHWPDVICYMITEISFTPEAAGKSQDLMITVHWCCCHLTQSKSTYWDYLSAHFLSVCPFLFSETASRTRKRCRAGLMPRFHRAVQYITIRFGTVRN